jgi:NAD(P)-dependent dehydrogenase (short-subunit alcohol dehydrogenase family)
MALSFTDFLKIQLFATIPKPTSPFTSQAVIITGGNTGLGYEAAKKVIELGASKVILACRSTQKGSVAKKSLVSSTACDPSVIEVWEIDMASFDSVKAFGARALKLERLDAVIQNAGVMMQKFESAEGTETTLTVNVISTFLLALLLLPKLKETARTFGVTPRLTIVGSALYSLGKFPDPQPENIWTWYNDKKNFDSMNQ